MLYILYMRHATRFRNVITVIGRSAMQHLSFRTVSELKLLASPLIKRLSVVAGPQPGNLTALHRRRSLL